MAFNHSNLMAKNGGKELCGEEEVRGREYGRVKREG